MKSEIAKGRCLCGAVSFSVSSIEDGVERLTSGSRELAQYRSIPEP